MESVKQLEEKQEIHEPITEVKEKEPETPKNPEIKKIILSNSLSSKTIEIEQTKQYLKEKLDALNELISLNKKRETDLLVTILEYNNIDLSKVKGVSFNKENNKELIVLL